MLSKNAKSVMKRTFTKRKSIPEDSYSSGVEHNATIRRAASLGPCNHGSMKLIVLGSSEVGRTSICRQFAGYDSITLEDGEEVYDTGIFLTVGQQKRQYDLEIFDINIEICKQNPAAFKPKLLSADGFLLVYSKDEKESFIKLLEILTDIRRFIKKETPLMVIGNKSDIGKKYIQVSKGDLQAVEAQCFDITSNDNKQVSGIFQSIVEQCVTAKDSEKARRSSAPNVLKKHEGE